MGKPDGLGNRIDQTGRDIQIRISEPVVHRVHQEGFGVLPKARVHRDGRRSHQHIKRDPLRFRKGQDGIKRVAADRCRFVQDALGRGPGSVANAVPVPAVVCFVGEFTLHDSRQAPPRFFHLGRLTTVRLPELG